MNNSTALLVGALALGGLTVQAHAQAPANPFEGTITWSMSMPMMGDDKHEMVVNVKGDKTETEMDVPMAGKMQIWADKAAKKTYMYMPGSHMAFESDMDDAAAKAKADKLDVKATGNKATIAGHSAEEYLVDLKDDNGDEQGQLSIWAAGDFPKDLMESMKRSVSGSARNQSSANAISELTAKGLVPVKIEMKKDGEEMMSMEFEKYEKKTLDNAIFELPKGVTFRPMPKNMGGMH